MNFYYAIDGEPLQVMRCTAAERKPVMQLWQDGSDRYWGRRFFVSSRYVLHGTGNHTTALYDRAEDKTYDISDLRSHGHLILGEDLYFSNDDGDHIPLCRVPLAQALQSPYGYKRVQAVIPPNQYDLLQSRRCGEYFFPVKGGFYTLFRQGEDYSILQFDLDGRMEGQTHPLRFSSGYRYAVFDIHGDTLFFAGDPPGTPRHCEAVWRYNIASDAHERVLTLEGFSGNPSWDYPRVLSIHAGVESFALHISYYSSKNMNTVELYTYEGEQIASFEQDFERVFTAAPNAFLLCGETEALLCTVDEKTVSWGKFCEGCVLAVQQDEFPTALAGSTNFEQEDIPQ